MIITIPFSPNDSAQRAINDLVFRMANDTVSDYQTDYKGLVRKLIPQDDSLNAVTEQSFVFLFKLLIVPTYVDIYDLCAYPKYLKIFESLAKKWIHQPNQIEEVSSILS